MGTIISPAHLQQLGMHSDNLDDGDHLQVPNADHASVKCMGTLHVFICHGDKSVCETVSGGILLVLGLSHFPH